MDIIIVIIFLILSGWALKSIGLLSEKDKVALNNVVIYVGMPALVFNSMLRNVHADELLSFFKLTFFILTVSVVTALTAYAFGKKILKLQPKSLAAFILVSACANTAFMGFPIITGFYGVEGFTRAIFCDVATLFTTVGLSTYLGSKVGGHKISIFRQILKFPPAIAWTLSLVLVLLGIDMSMVPPFLSTVLEMLSGIVVPLIMLSLGISLSGKYLKLAFIPAVSVTVLHLIFMPLIGSLALPLFQFAELDKKVAIIEAGMPPALTPIVFAEIYGFDTKLISAATFLATSISLVSVPVLHLILEAGLI